MRKFLIKTVCISFPILLTIVVINYVIDPAKLFNTGYVHKMISILDENKFVTNLTNYNERIFQKEVVIQQKKTYNTRFIGSSRGMLLNEHLFCDKLFYNNAVSGATLKDLICIYQLLKEEGELPSKLIIGIDPWTFNQNNKSESWKVYSEFYYRFHKKRPALFNELHVYNELLSLSYFQNSLKQFSTLYLPAILPQGTKNIYNKTNTKLTDGSIGYGTDTYRIPQEKIFKGIQTELTLKIDRIEGFSSISTQLFNEFTLLVNQAREEQIEVFIYMEPLYPELYDRIKSAYPNVILSEEKVRKYARSQGIECIGSFDPRLFDLKQTHFYNGLHCTESAIDLITQKSNLKKLFCAK